MRHVLFSREIVGSRPWAGRVADVLAQADAAFDEPSGGLEVRLTSAATAGDGRPDPLPAQPSWLPAPQTVHEHLAYAEALPAAQAIFRSWARRVREQLPAADNPNPQP